MKLLKLLALALASLFLAGSQAVSLRSPPPWLVPPANPPLATRSKLPPLARSLLSQRMETHAVLMTELMWGVIFLDHEATREAAEEIADAGPRIARPMKGGDATDLSSQLPTRFFDLQDEVGARARELRRAAIVGDDARITQVWGQLSETCVSCHALYLEEEAGRN